jgi:OmpA-OmpF porin, OOP family
MKKYPFFVFYFGLKFIGVFPVFAQNGPDVSPTYEGPNRLNTWSLTMRGGMSQFYGDLRTYDFLPLTTTDQVPGEWGTWSAGFSVNKQLSHLFGLALNVDAGTLAGTKQRLYNSYFRSEFYQTSLTGVINMKSLLLGTQKLPRWKIDLWAGVGLMGFSSVAYEIGSNRIQRFTNGQGQPERYGYRSRRFPSGQITDARFTHEWVLPTGLTIQYEVSPRIDLGLEVALHHVNTEKLDATVGNDFSAWYDTDPNSNKGNIFGNQTGISARDKWGHLSLVLTYKLGKRAVSGRHGNWDAGRGTYHLRWTDPRQLLPKPKILTMSEIDSVAKANRPSEIDPRLLLDSDGDGVSDFFDKEPNTPAGSFVTGRGERLDIDQYLNNLTMAIDNNPCLEVFTNVQFDTDKVVVKTQYEAMLGKLAELMTKTRCRLQLTGHADRRASDRYNIELSERRVQSVKKYLLTAANLDASRILTDSFGSFKPTADNGTAEGRARNRRVEIRLLPAAD